MAVKIMRNFDEERLQVAQKEFEIIHDVLDHENIVKAKELFVDVKEIHIVMELVEEGKELGDTIKDYGERYNENVARKMFKQIMSAIEYMH